MNELDPFTTAGQDAQIRAFLDHDDLPLDCAPSTNRVIAGLMLVRNELRTPAPAHVEEQRLRDAKRVVRSLLRESFLLHHFDSAFAFVTR